MTRLATSRSAGALAVIVLTASAATLRAQSADRAGNLKAIADAERAFASAAGTGETQKAFLAFIADSGILFQPRAVKAKTTMQANPRPGNGAVLAWEPQWLDVSLAGDMGYDSGPYTFRPKDAPDSLVSRGTFMTIWQRQADGRFKFLVDFGAPGGTTPVHVDSVTAPPASLVASKPMDASTARSQILALDSRLATDTLGAARRPGVVAHLAPYAHFLRTDMDGPAIGTDAIGTLLARTEGVLALHREGDGVSRSGDLGYTYGTYELRAPGADRTADVQGNFVRIYRRDAGGRWSLVVDVSNPMPRSR